MMKRAFAFEQREKKIASYFYKIQQLEVDYSAEVEAMIRANKKDRGLILQAERENFKVNK